MNPKKILIEENGSPEFFGFREILKKIEDAIEKFGLGPTSNIAIIAEPFSGRTLLLNKISEPRRQKDPKMVFRRLVTDDKFLEAIGKSRDIVFMDNCHLLYSRKIGGFKRLELFLNTASSSDKLFITSWNKFSWSFLRLVFPLESVFPIRIELPKMDANDLKQMIMSTCESQVTFSQNHEISKKEWLEFSKYSVSLTLNRALKVSVPKLDYSILKSRLPARIGPSEQKEEASVEDKVFQRLIDASEGNPGVAKAVWKRSISNTEGEIGPEDIKKPQYKIDISYDQAFLLYLILSMEYVSIDELKDILDLDPYVNASVHHLEEIGLISFEKGLLSIIPEALHSIESYLKSMRLVL